MNKHVPVLVNEVVQYLDIKPHGIYVDCTMGYGGHSTAILSKLTTGKLICFEKDNNFLNEVHDVLTKVATNFIIVKSDFQDLKSQLIKLGINKVDGVFYDLGLSTMQIDDQTRGFSYENDGMLDMRFNQDQQLTAYDVVNFYSIKKLTDIFFKYGEERYARIIASKIEHDRQKSSIKTTTQLADLIKNTLFYHKRQNFKLTITSIRRIFQAIRIEVNNELNVFKKSLNDAVSILNEEGRLVVISFHSLEDRIVKLFFKYLSVNDFGFQILTKKPIIPAANELLLNPKSHSAKLRAIKKTF